MFDETIKWLIRPNTYPLISWLTPTNGATFTGGSNLTLTVSASDTNSYLKKVNFYRDGLRIGIANSLIGTSNILVWSNAPGGTYFMTARAVDNGGLSATTTQLVPCPGKPRC